MYSPIVSRIPRSVVLAAGIVVMSQSATARAADTEHAATAEALFQAGKALLDADRVEEACERLGESYREDPALGTLGMLAWCHEQQGRTATAWGEYLQVEQLAGQAGQLDRKQVAHEHAESMANRLSMLRIDVPHEVPGLVVTRQFQAFDKSNWGTAFAVDPGEWVIEVSAPGFLPWRRVVTVPTDKAVVILEVPALVEKTPPVPSTPVARPVQAPHRDLGTRDWRGPAIALGAGVVGIAAGSVFGIRTLTKHSESKSHCDASNACDATGGRLRDEARNSGTLADVGFGLGAAGVIVAGWLWFRNDRAPSPPPTSVGMTLSARPHQGGVAITGAF